MMTATEKYCIRDYQSGDEKSISSLFSEVFSKTMTHQQWYWKYGGMGSKTFFAKVAFDRQQKLIGHAGAIPLRGFYQGKPIPFFQICDVMVHAPARGYLGKRNLFNELMRSLLSDIARRFPQAFSYGFPGHRPFLLGERARFYAKVEYAVETIRKPCRRDIIPLFRIDPLGWTDLRLNPLWEGLSPQFGLALIRDDHYLNWRYAANPFHTYDLFGLFVLDQLLGWAVVRQQQDCLWIIDLLVNRHWLRSALVAIDQFAASLGVRTIIFWLPAGWRTAAGDNITTPVVTANMIWRSSFDPAGVRDHLFYTMGDSDIF